MATSSGVSRSVVGNAVPQRGGAAARWAWARHWEFWLALALGAALRLWRIDLTQFLDDQVGLMTVARFATTHGLIPLTGIPSSIHTLNPPLSEWILLPFTLFTANPMPVAVGVALWNILGIGLCYSFTLRYFGRRLAAVSTLLFATGGAAINYNRFLWQQNYLPPVILLWLITLYLGCVDGRRRWFALNVTLLGIGALLHPTAALLAPVTLVAVALAPRRPPLRAWIVAAVALLLLASPTLLWEGLSHFSDVTAARQFAGGHAKIDVAILYYLYQALGGPTGNPLVAHTLVGKLHFFGALNVLATALFAVGWLWLTWRIMEPARRLPWRREQGTWRALREWSVAVYQGLRASPGWRVNTLLWLSVTVPVALMIRHTGRVFAHYLIILYPTMFIVSAMGVVALFTWVTQWFERRGSRRTSAVALALEVALLALLVARGAQWILYPQSLTDPRTFNAYHDYGYPLSVIQSGAATLDTLQHATGASGAEVIAPDPHRYLTAAGYIFAWEQPSHITVMEECLALPPTGSGSWLITSVVAKAPASEIAASLTGAHQVGALRMVGGPDYPVFQVDGAARLPNETSLPAMTFTDGQGNTLRLEAVAPLSGGKVALRWTVLATQTPANQTRLIGVTATQGGATSYAGCEPQRWLAGETLYTVVSGQGGGGDMTVGVSSATDGLATPSLGPLHFLSDQPVGEPTTALRASPAPYTVNPGITSVAPSGAGVVIARSALP